jgi:hypothetical protein
VSPTDNNSCMKLENKSETELKLSNSVSDSNKSLLSVSQESCKINKISQVLTSPYKFLLRFVNEKLYASL